MICCVKIKYYNILLTLFTKISIRNSDNNNKNNSKQPHTLQAAISPSSDTRSRSIDFRVLFILGRRVEGQLHTHVFHPPPLSRHGRRGLFEPGVHVRVVGGERMCACKRINSDIGLDASFTICAYNHVTLEIAPSPTVHYATTGHQCQFV